MKFFRNRAECLIPVFHGYSSLNYIFCRSSQPSSVYTVVDTVLTVLLTGLDGTSFPKFFCLLLFQGAFTSVCRDKKSKRSYNIAEI